MIHLNRRHFAPANGLFAELDRFFNRTFTRNPFFSQREETGVYESEKAWYLRADLPGFEKEEVALSLDDGVLILSARRENNDSFPRSEEERRFRLPEGIDSAAIEAKLTNGVLEVTLPKAEPDTPEPLRIEIN